MRVADLQRYEIDPDHLLVRMLANACAASRGAARVGGDDGVGERVYLPSVVQTAQVIGMFIRDRCGLS